MDQMSARMVFLNAQDYLSQAGYNPTQISAAKLTQSYLRFEQPLSTSTTLINFPVLINQGVTPRPTEKRLNLQDAFIVSSLGLYITKAASATDTAFELKTYNNPITFPTGATPLNTLYNSFLQITINSDVVSPAIDVERFRIAPQTQLTGATNSPIDEFEGGGVRSNMYAIEPNVVFIGQKNTQLVLSMPAALSAIDANSYVVIIARGILAQNVTVVS